jgi:hypothetical protein
MAEIKRRRQTLTFGECLPSSFEAIELTEEGVGFSVFIYLNWSG